MAKDYDYNALPAHAMLRVEITADQKVLVNGRPVPVPLGDARAAALNAAADYARTLGHPARLLLRTPDGRSHRLVAEPGARMSPRSHQAAAAAQPETAGPETARPETAGPETDVGEIPAWPCLQITLHPDGSADVEGRPVAPRPGVAIRQAAIAAAARYARELGLDRSVRAEAVDPDGLRWPLLVHADGTATSAGPPQRLKWAKGPGGKSTRAPA